jgi:hypothetical protein
VRTGLAIMEGLLLSPITAVKASWRTWIVNYGNRLRDGGASSKIYTFFDAMGGKEHDPLMLLQPSK